MLHCALLLIWMLLMFNSSASAENNAPEWYKNGAYVYRIQTPNANDVLPRVEEGVTMVSNLLDGTIPQITFLNGIIGHDHRGMFNWDGAWPYWNRVTFRANHSWDDLRDFMKRVKDEHNVFISFHVNLTDVNVGLKDYPETRAFFQKLVETQSIYRRDWNRETNKRDTEPPYVPTEIPDGDDPVPIFALVNYKNFWDSGLAKKMIDEFYGQLPYVPPLLYVDVLTLAGGNFATGYPDGPLGGSKESQAQGRQAIVDYIRSKGSEVAAEGTGTMREINSTYGWYHGQGVSDDDYSHIAGTSWNPFIMHVWGCPDALHVWPAASTQQGLQLVREHYQRLLAGQLGLKAMPGLCSVHLWTLGGWMNVLGGEHEKRPTGYTADYADAVNNFYLMVIQELYHIGKGNKRVQKHYSGGVHLWKLAVSDPFSVFQTTVEAADFVANPQEREQARKAHDVAIGGPFSMTVTVPKAGVYKMLMYHSCHEGEGEANLYVNDQFVRRVDGFRRNFKLELQTDLGEVTLHAGENKITIDQGQVWARWDDGTQACWATPYLGKGYSVTNGAVTFAVDYDRMWPDTWSGQKKIYFFSWDGTNRAWKLPSDWGAVPRATLYPLTPDGRGKGVPLAIKDRTIAPALLPQVPYILVPENAVKGAAR